MNPLRLEKALDSCLLALSAEIVDGGCYCSVRIHRYVNVLMDQEVVAWSLTDDFDVVHAGLYKRK